MIQGGRQEQRQDSVQPKPAQGTGASWSNPQNRDTDSERKQRENER